MRRLEASRIGEPRIATRDIANAPPLAGGVTRPPQCIGPYEITAVLAGNVVTSAYTAAFVFVAPGTFLESCRSGTGLLLDNGFAYEANAYPTTETPPAAEV